MKLGSFDVTAEDIAKGIRGDPQACPIAQALMRVSPECYPEVDSMVLLQDWLWEGEHRFIMDLTLLDWMGRFDAGHTVDPIAINVVDHGEQNNQGYLELA